jgi:hypothetical protein
MTKVVEHYEAVAIPQKFIEKSLNFHKLGL